MGVFKDILKDIFQPGWDDVEEHPVVMSADFRWADRERGNPAVNQNFPCGISCVLVVFVVQNKTPPQKL